jgi:uncharacterized protein YbjT (DUF2867 family)
MSKMNRFLVLGACGNVGQCVVSELANRFPQSTVLASVRPKGMSPPPEHWKSRPNVTPVEVELDDTSSIAAAMKGVDRVFFVPQNTPKQLQHDRNVTKVVKSSDSVDFYVRQSVCSGLTSRDSDCAFSIMHKQAEAELADTGIRYAILRPNFAMMNVFFLVVPSLPYGGVRWPWPGDLEVAHVDPRDAGAVGAVLLGTSDTERHHGKGVHVAGPERWTPSAIVAEVAAKCGQKDVRYLPVAYDEFESMLIEGANMAPWMAKAVNGVFRDVQQACEDGTMYLDDTGPDGAIPFEALVGRKKYGFSEFLGFFSVSDAYHRMKQHSPDNPNY